MFWCSRDEKTDRPTAANSSEVTDIMVEAFVFSDSARVEAQMTIRKRSKSSLSGDYLCNIYYISIWKEPLRLDK